MSTPREGSWDLGWCCPHFRDVGGAGWDLRKIEE